MKRYLDILRGAYVRRQLPPWFENLSKLPVKLPKVYSRDPGALGLREWLDIAELSILESLQRKSMKRTLRNWYD